MITRTKIHSCCSPNDREKRNTYVMSDLFHFASTVIHSCTMFICLMLRLIFRGITFNTIIIMFTFIRSLTKILLKNNFWISMDSLHSVFD